MAGIRYKGQIFSGSASFGDADHVAYDNTESGLTATNVQDALDELCLNIPDPDGAVIYGTNGSSTVTTQNETVTELSSIILPKGTWLVIGCADWGVSQTGYRQISIDGAAKNPSRPTATTVSGQSNKEVYQQVTRIIVTNAGHTAILSAYQNSGGALICYPYFYAVRLF